MNFFRSAKYELACTAFFCLLACSPSGAQTSAPSSGNPESSFIAAFRTSAHVKRSSPLAFNQAVDDVVEFLRSSGVALANDPLRDSSRVIPRLQEDMSREDLLASAKDAGATYLLVLTVDRPFAPWIKLKLECFDQVGKPLWEEEASYGGGVTGASAVTKTVEKLKRQLQVRLGQPGLPVDTAAQQRERTIESAPEAVVSEIPSSNAAQIPSTPPWPDINFTSCPMIVAPVDPSQRTWKHGQSEQAQFAAMLQAYQAKDYRRTAEEAARFAEGYSDSDYRDAALIEEISIVEQLVRSSSGDETNLTKDKNSEIAAAENLVRSNSATSVAQMVGFATLAGVSSTFVFPFLDDPAKERKLADLETWTRCGLEALAAKNPTPEDRKHVESILERTNGLVALVRQNYLLAISKLESARDLNSEDALTYLWLFEAKAWSPNPDVNSGVFYLARYEALSPANPGAGNLLKQVYVTAHGSERDLQKVRAVAKTNTTPPARFSVLAPPKKDHHYVTAIAATAIIGLLAYEAVRHPWLVESYGSNEGPAAPVSGKTMIFGGPGHRTYLGCLSCQELAPDSVFNEVGQHGSPVSPDSIWNRVGQYGSRISPYSACNPLAADPPVIVDESGNAYGRLTVNKYNSEIGAGARFYDWLASTLCER